MFQPAAAQKQPRKKQGLDPEAVHGLDPEASETVAGSLAVSRRHELSCGLKRMPFALTQPAKPVNLQSRKGLKLPSCAVVSSSGAMKGSGLGKDIDAHDIVWRLNLARTKGWEKDVGTREDVRFLNDHGPDWLMKGNQQFSKDVAYIFDRMGCVDYFDDVFGQLARKHPEGRYGAVGLDTTKAFGKFMDSEFKLKGVVASTGAIAVISALQLCDTVDLYHMHRTTSNGTMGESVSYHYWEPIDDARLGAIQFHKGFIRQDDVYKQLATEESLRNADTSGKLSLEGLSGMQCDD